MKLKKSIKTSIFSLILVVATSSVFSSIFTADSPSYFTTRNFAPYESNAKVKGIWSPYPTPPGSPDSPSEKSVSWGKLRIICGLFSSTCDAEIYMKTDTSNPVYVGKGTMNLKTGEIEPKSLTNNGFTLTSSEPGVIEIREENQ